MTRWSMFGAIAGGVCVGLVLHDVIVHLFPGL